MMRKAYKTALKPLKKLARSAEKRGEYETAYAYALAMALLGKSARGIKKATKEI